MELLWRLASLAPAALLEANFRPRSAYERAKLAALSGPLVEVHCRCPPQLAAARYAARHPGRHPTHVSGTISPQLLAEFDGPMGLGPVIEADTAAAVDIAALAAAVEAALQAATPPP
jgi:hypothetical protein